MTRTLRQSTSTTVRIGSFVDSVDGVTPEVGVTLGAADQAEVLRAGTATLDISGATWAAVTGADGWYTLTLDTTATNTVGELIVVVQDASVCLPVFCTFQVVEEAVYDALFAASATGSSTDVTAIKAKTDSLVFTSGSVNANIEYVNAIQVVGDGQTGTEWGPA
jgi:hypothetical protein